MSVNPRESGELFEVSMYYLGVDPGAKLGVGIVQDDEVIFTAKLITDGCTIEVRLQKIYAYLTSIIGRYPEIAFAVVEDQYLGSHGNVRSNAKLNKAAGAAFAVLAGNGINAVFVAPSTWQSTVINVSKPSKSDTMANIALRFPRLGKVSNDQADAIAMAVYAQQFHRYRG